MTKGKIAFILLLIFNYVILVFVLDFGSTSDNTNYKNTIEILEEENRELKSANKKLDKEVAQLTLKADSLTAEIKIKATHREELKLKRDEKMDSISSMDNDKLYSFFTEFKTDSLTSKPRH